MAKESLFEDFTRVASGAFSALSGVRDEVETRIREQVERILARMDMVTREDFEIVKEMAVLARSQQEALEMRVAVLEAALLEKSSGLDKGIGDEPAHSAGDTESPRKTVQD